jgi:serine/threonine protein phosphatase PrpC
MAASMVFVTAALSHVGKVRTVNEDRLLTRDDLALWAVADGMGGLGGGDIASGALVDSLDTIPAGTSGAALLDAIEDRVATVNGYLRAHAAANGGRMLGTTLAALVIQDAHCGCAWSGDSRIYRVRKGALVQLTRDHSEVQELVDRGILDADEARSWPGRNVITRAVGVYEQVELEFRQDDVNPGDRFILCSDGLTNHVADDEIARYVAGYEPGKACEFLVALTLQRGATDNVTLIVVGCERAGETERGETTVVAPAPAGRAAPEA